MTSSAAGQSSASGNPNEIPKEALVKWLGTTYDIPPALAETVFDEHDDDASGSIEIEEFVVIVKGLERGDEAKRAKERIAGVLAGDRQAEGEWEAFATSSPWIARQHVRLAELRRTHQRTCTRGESETWGNMLNLNGVGKVAAVFSQREDAREAELREERRVVASKKGTQLALYAFAKLPRSEIGLYDIVWVWCWDVTSASEVYFCEKTGERVEDCPAGVEWVRAFDEFGWTQYTNTLTGRTQYRHPHVHAALKPGGGLVCV
tara:strand:- start:373 stop:1158 length:786 start_codon:yes stop_codon:yes gene_type:complete